MTISYNEYYKREISVKDFGSQGLALLKSSHVVIIGAGGLGHPAITALALTGVGKLTIVDHDVVDSTNLHRQFLFSLSDIGLFKSDVCSREILKKNLFVDIKSVPTRFSLKNGLSIIEGADLVLDCSDNFETKFLIHDLCQLKKKKLVQGSIHQHEGHLFYFDFLTGPCFRCLYPEAIDNNCVQNCAEAGVLSYVPMIFGNFQASLAVQILLGKMNRNSGQQWIFNTTNFDSYYVSIKKKSDCLFCQGQLTENQVKQLHIRQHLITPEEVVPLASQYVWVDIRTREEININPFNALAGIETVNLFENDDLLRNLPNDRQYLFFCESGVRSTRLVNLLLKQNKTNIVGLISGISGLKSAIRHF